MEQKCDWTMIILFIRKWKEKGLVECLQASARWMTQGQNNICLNSIHSPAAVAVRNSPLSLEVGIIILVNTFCPMCWEVFKICSFSWGFYVWVLKFRLLNICVCMCTFVWIRQIGLSNFGNPTNLKEGKTLVEYW